MKNKYLLGISMLFFFFMCLYYYFNYSYKPVNKLAFENIDVEIDENTLGIKEDTEKPALIIQNDSNVVFVGNRNYDVKPVAIDNFGEVEISYDESKIDFSKAGNYQLGVIAKDPADNETRKDATITVKNKPVIKKTNPIAVNNRSDDNKNSNNRYDLGNGENIGQKMHSLCRMMGSQRCYDTIGATNDSEHASKMQNNCGSNWEEMEKIYFELVKEVGYVSCSVEDWE